MSNNNDKREDLMTYYLIVDEEPDRAMALEYLQKKGIEPHGDKTRAVTEMRVDRLTDRHRVIGLFRKAHKDRNKRMAAPEPGMAPVMEAQHQPIEETPPIMISKYWDRGNRSEFIEGELRIAPFFGELSKLMSPALVAWHPNQEPGVLRMKYS